MSADIPPSTLVSAAATDWLARVRAWGPQRLEVILAADPADVYGLLADHVIDLGARAHDLGARRALARPLVRLEELRSLARLVQPVRGELSPVATIAAEGLRRPGWVEWVWGPGAGARAADGVG